MKPITPHDPLDDLIAAALHGDLSPNERAQFESRLSSDPAAQAAYQEAQAMHDLLERTHRSAQPDPDFEQRMVSGVRRKLAQPPGRETALESLLILWRSAAGVWHITARILGGRSLAVYGGVCSAIVAVCLMFAVWQGNQVKSVFSTITSQLAVAQDGRALAQIQDFDALKADNLKRVIDKQGLAYVDTAHKGITLGGYVDTSYAQAFGGKAKTFNNGTINSDRLARIGSGVMTLPGANTYTGGTAMNGGAITLNAGATTVTSNPPELAMGSALPTPGKATFSGNITYGSPISAPSSVPNDAATSTMIASADKTKGQNLEPDTGLPMSPPATASATPIAKAEDTTAGAVASTPTTTLAYNSPDASAVPNAPFHESDNKVPDAARLPGGKPTPTQAPAPVDDRKLIRNAQLDLEVKSYQNAVDQVTQLTRSAGGYVDTSNSQRGGNGKLQGTIVAKILPQNLDAFLLKLHDLGDVQNQSVSTDDVTKDYYDTQARIANSQKMEEQLQELLKRENGKVSDLLAVERELGRVRGEIEQMQGQLKLYDFQVQFATVTMNIAEKDLNQTAAYLLKEQDEFALYATDVEATFQQARQAADDFKTQVLVANLEHDSGTQVSAELTVMVAPDQIEAFLGKVRGLGRVANFTRQTQRVAKDGGDANQPADQTLTEKDKVQVHVTIHSDDDSRKQVALAVVAKQVDDALDKAKAAAQSTAGVQILGSSLNTTPQGESTGSLSVRVPGQEYATLMDAFRALGRQASLSIQRNDNSGPGASGDDAPVILSLSLTDSDTPVQVTDLSISAEDVDAQAQAIKRAAADAGVEVKASTFERQPDGSEVANLTLGLPLSKYAAFIATVQKAGKTDSLSVQRDDRPDQARTDDTAPAQINLQLHSRFQIVAENTGLWGTLSHTFGAGVTTLLSCITVIGVVIAFLIPWSIALLLAAWIGRRIYVWRKNR